MTLGACIAAVIVIAAFATRRYPPLNTGKAVGLQSVR